MKKNSPGAVFLATVVLLCALLSACGAKKSPAPEEIARFSYYSEDVGFGIVYPEDYIALTPDEIQELMAYSIELINMAFDDPEDMAEALSRSIPVTYASKYPVGYAEGANPNINIIVQKVSWFYTLDIVAFVDRAVEEAEKQESYPIAYGKAAQVQVGGKNAAVVDATMNIEGMEILQKQYHIPNNGYLAIITLAGETEEALSELSGIIDTIEFLG